MKLGQWLGFVVLIASAYVLWQIRELVLLIFTAIVFATALNRIRRTLQGLGLKKRSLALCCSVVLVFGTIGIFSLLIVPPFITQVQELLAIVPKVWDEIRLFILNFEEMTPDWVPAPPSTAEIITQLQPFTTEVLGRFLSAFNTSLAVIVQLLLVLVLSIMLVADPTTYRQGFLKLFPSFYRRRADEILCETEIALSNWMGGILINCCFIGTLSGIGLLVLGIPLVLAHALLAGLLNFIPNIGPAMSVVFPVMVALLDNPWKIIPIIIWYVVIQNIESYWLTPTVMARQVSLLPAVTLGAQIFFASSFGILGLLLALPLTVVAKTWIEQVLFHDILDRWNQPSQLRWSTGDAELADSGYPQFDTTIAPPELTVESASPEPGNKQEERETL